ncbi:MAG: class E sortase [Actinocatenispora sp.]
MTYRGYRGPGDDETVVIPVVRSALRSHRARSRRSRSSERSRPPVTDGPVRRIVRGFGELLITFGLVVLLFAGYEVWGKQLIIHKQQDKYNSQLEKLWAAPPKKADDAPPLPGQALARLYIPRFGIKLAVVEGVTQEDIRNAPGHYPDSAMPGQIGNFAVAGHREDAIFPRNFNELQINAPIVVQTRTTWFVYRVYQQEIVVPTQVDVVNPVPDKPADVKPTQALITLTTCNPWWDNYQRLIYHGKLIRQQPIKDGEPDELKG